MPRSTGMRYCSITLFHWLTSLVESFNMALPGHTHHTRLLRFSTAKQHSWLTWPARLADVSSMEHLWDILDHRVRQKNPLQQTLQELFFDLQNEWQKTPLNTLFKILLPVGIIIVHLTLLYKEDITDSVHFWHPVIDSHHVTHFSFKTPSPEWRRLQLDNAVTKIVSHHNEIFKL